MPDPDGAAIEVRAAGCNFADALIRAGRYPQMPELPFVPGSEVAGELDGRRVVAFVRGSGGGYAERVAADPEWTFDLPERASFAQGAAFLLAYLTAWLPLTRQARLERGGTVLVHAAAGGVGLIMCQWAAALGATVIGTVSTDEKAELARTHGCAHPVVYTRQDFVAEVERITAGEKLPVVYDGVGRDTFMKSLDCLRRRAIMVSFGNASGPVDAFAPATLAQKGSLFLTRPTLFDYIATRAELERAAGELFDVVESGKVKIEVKQRLPLKDAAEAHRQLEARKTTGSTILTI